VDTELFLQLIERPDTAQRLAGNKTHATVVPIEPRLNLERVFRIQKVSDALGQALQLIYVQLIGSPE